MVGVRYEKLYNTKYIKKIINESLNDEASALDVQLNRVSSLHGIVFLINYSSLSAKLTLRTNEK